MVKPTKQDKILGVMAVAAKGSATIPKAVRKRLGLEHGGLLVFIEKDGEVIVKRGEVVVKDAKDVEGLKRNASS